MIGVKNQQQQQQPEKLLLASQTIDWEHLARFKMAAALLQVNVISTKPLI